MAAKIVSLMLAVVLYGQLIYTSLNYYASIGSPSYFFWIGILLLSGYFFIVRFNKNKIMLADLIYASMVLYIFVNFNLFGQSSPSEFYFRMISVVLMPYICGRILGKHLGGHLFYYMQIVLGFYVLLITAEVLSNPGILSGDRLVLFNNSYGIGNNTGGDSTLYNIGLTFGSLWIASLAILIKPKKTIFKGVIELLRPVPRESIYNKRSRLWFVVLLTPIIILSVGSRASAVTMLLSAAVLVFLIRLSKTRRKKQSDKFRVIKVNSVIALIIIGGNMVYSNLSEDRKLLLQEFGNVLGNFDAHFVKEECDEKTSFTTRITQIRESLRMFETSPLLGVGVSNFGWNYCAEKTAFASPHNTFLHVLAEQGVVGFTIFSAFFITIIAAIVRQLKSQLHRSHTTLWILLSLFIYFLVQIQFNGNLFVDYHLFLLCGLLVSSTNVEKVPVKALIAFEDLPRQAART